MRPWMKERVYFLDVVSIDVGVDLCRSDVGVTEHLLDCAQICTTFEEMRRKGMAEHVRMNVLRDIGADTRFLDDVPDGHA